MINPSSERSSSTRITGSFTSSSSSCVLSKTQISPSRSCRLIIAAGRKSSPESRSGLYRGNAASPHNHSSMCTTLSLPRRRPGSFSFVFCCRCSVKWHQRQDWARGLRQRLLRWRLPQCPWALEVSHNDTPEKLNQRTFWPTWGSVNKVVTDSSAGNEPID